MKPQKEEYEKLKHLYTDFIIDNTTDITLSLDINGNILFANKSACTLYGYSFDEMIGKNAAFLFSETGLFKTMLEKIREKGKYRFIAKKLKRSGSIFYVSCNTIYVYQESSSPIILMIERDITDIIEYQRILMRFIQEEFLMKEILELFLSSKDYIEAINFLYERFSNNLKLSCIEMFENDVLAYSVGTKTIKVKEIEFYSPLENKKIVFKVYIKESDLEIDIIDNLETILFYIFSNLFNIIEKFKMIQMLQIEKQKAEESDRLKTEFLANMSHEIRTPLNVMSGYLQLLSKTNLDSEQNEYLEMATKSSHQLFLLISEILELSKIETGQLSLEKKDIEPYSFFKQISQIYSLKAKEKQIEFLEEIGELPEKLIGDPVILGRIFSNILDNAVKFTEKGSIRLKIERDSKSILVEISDTGIGIPKEKEELVFKKFVQLDGSPRRKYGGTGAGLTIVKAMLELMGGMIYFKSQEKEGTTFFFSFPISL